MKTKTFVRTIQFSLLILVTVFIQSCETEIPPEDPTPPTFSFRIYGDGFDHTFNQDTDFDNIKLNLKRFTSYNFTYIGSDAGGVERVQWNILPARLVNIETIIPASWVRTYSTANEEVRWNGDRSNPLTGAIITGSFKAPYSRERGVFRFSVTDFGGETRRPNSIIKELNISTGNVVHIGVIPI